MSESLTQEEYDALRWVHEHHVLFPTVGAQSADTPIAETHFKNWVLCRIGRYASNIHGRATPFAEVLHASSWTNVRGMSHMGEVIVALHRDNQLFESGIESPNPDSPSGTSLYSYTGLGSSDYEGGADKFYPHDVTARDPFVGFAEEMDERLSDAQERLLDYHSSIADLAERVATNDPGHDFYHSVREEIEAVQTAHGYVDDYGWLLGAIPGGMAETLRSHNYVGRIQDVISAPTWSRAFQAADFIDTINTASRLSVQIRSAAGPLSGSSAVAADRLSSFLGVLRVACSFLPILGDFYAKMFDGIPGLIASYRNSVDSYVRRIDATIAAAEGRPRPPGPPHRRACARCGLDVAYPCRPSQR
ncbi:MAG: hypothetical protein KJP18_06800 [Gemmatimonadetes bacterium]|nr:hypothetical protein [Gemmatimonadota bacterium]NNK63444.1 hypothetical protein [Gemmatimonadota bacterium]